MDEFFKQCSLCKDWKAETSFYKQKEGKYGLSARCKNCVNKSTYAYRKENKCAERMTYRYSFARCSARNRRKPFSLSLAEYSHVASKPCFYCDGFFGRVKVCSGLDRIDNSKGYELTNVLPSCAICNRMRNVNFSVEETRIMAQTVIQLRTANRGD